MRSWALAALAFATAAAADERPHFRWPVIGAISKSADGHGVDILAPVGEAVHAAGDGDVIYAGDELASFGKMIVLRHANGYTTTYAYLSEIAVAQGASVKRGEIVGQSGATGDAKRPELHFELRKGDATLDARGYMTAR